MSPGLVDPGRRANYRKLLAERYFRRFFIGQFFSSFGDWVGLLAILALVKRIYDDEFAVAAVLLARIGPALFFGPIAGVVADRWNRKRVMVSCDLLRAALIAILPFVGTISRNVPLLSPVVLLFIVSGAMETLTLIWQPAKDATVPEMVKRSDYTHAYSLLLLAVYATFPLSGAVFGLLANASRWIGESLQLREIVLNREHLAFFFDAFTFLISAALTLSLRLPAKVGIKKPLNFKAVWEDLLDGIRYVVRHPMVRPWVVGIGGTFAGIGVFLSMALFFVSDVLKGGEGSYGLLVTAVGLGLGLGFLLAGPVSRAIPKDVLFASTVMAMGASILWFGSVSTPSAALVLGGICGLFGGFAYPTGYALIQERLREDMRGRASAAVNVVIRSAIVGASAITPVFVKIVDQIFKEPVLLSGQSVDLRGVRVVMWLGGIVIFGAGLVTTEAIRARWRMRMPAPGLLVVFEGGEGAGKSTQIQNLKSYLESRGRSVLVTREPGGTAIGEQVRQILLDPANSNMASKAEALLYAADRAQHVEEVIRPALENGITVISDRYIDSSVAYQGLARGLGLEEVRNLSRWGTDGLFPDLVFLLDHGAKEGLARSGATDRIEQESLEFHEKVRQAFLVLAQRYSERFVVVDGSQPPDRVEADIRTGIEPFLGKERASARDPKAFAS